MLAVTVWEFMFVELWRYSETLPTPYQPIYRTVNCVEALIWLGFAVAVVYRNRRHRRSSLELFYAGLFFIFAMTDVREMFVVQPWLILFKGLVLVGILWVRHVVRKRFYPESKW
jgi:uncharacterized membrane protein